MSTVRSSMMQKQSAVRSFATRRSPLPSRVVLKATPSESEAKTETTAPSVAEPTIFYMGKSYTETEYQAVLATMPPLEKLWAPKADLPSFSKVMGFNGSPEIINGRLAMMGFIAAVGAELSSGESVLRQAAEEPAGVVALFTLLIAASLVPAFLNTKREAFGPFNPDAEMLNGRASMIGFAAMLAIEANMGQALF